MANRPILQALRSVRRRAIVGALAAALLGGCSTRPPAAPQAPAPPPPPPAPAPSPPPPPPPVVFVHGNGDNAAQWMTTIWRFESNGWPRDRLHAIDLPYPLARDDDTKPQPGRTSTTQHAQYLAAEVDKVLAAIGASQVVLVGNSRGGLAIRNYVQNFGGADKVSHAILGGTPNHGIWAIASLRPNNEFNGAGPFLTGLNAPKGPDGDEVVAGVRWLTLRSDNNDKFAQPDGAWIGAKGTPTQVTFDGPALKGATNLVLPARDRRELSFHAEAFVPTFEFITGRKPQQMDIVAEAEPVLDGEVSGLGPGGPSNLPLAGATLEVYAVDAFGARLGAARHRRDIGADGRWGPFRAEAGVAYEFVVRAPGYATTHIYRSPFPRSSEVVHLRAERLAPADKRAASVVTLSRPRGYFGVPRDQVLLDGQNPAPGIPRGVPGVSMSKLVLKQGAGRAVVAEFESGAVLERVVGRAWPAAENRVVILELTN